MDEHDKLISEALKLSNENKKLVNRGLKNSWWKSIITFFSGAVIATLPVVLTNYQNTLQTEKTIESIEQSITRLDSAIFLLIEEDNNLKGVEQQQNL
jgi:hypothetical protein